MARILELILAAVQDYEVKPMNHIVVSCQQRHLPQVCIICLLVECLLSRQFPYIILHRVGVVVAGVVRFRQVIPVRHLVVVVARHIKHRCVATVLESLPAVVCNHLPYLFPVSLRNGGIARAVATQQQHINLLLVPDAA